MTHFDMITADGELWRDVIAAEMSELNIKEAYLLTADEYKYLKDKADQRPNPEGLVIVGERDRKPALTRGLKRKVK